MNCKLRKYSIKDESELNTLHEKSLDHFINEKSRQFFERFRIKTTFLKEDPGSWNQNVDFKAGEAIVKQLRVTNDVPERAVKFVEENINRLTWDEENKQYMLQIVEEYKKQFPTSNKFSL